MYEALIFNVPLKGCAKINVREIGVRENWMRENKMREIWSWAKIKWIKVLRRFFKTSHFHCLRPLLKLKTNVSYVLP